MKRFSVLVKLEIKKSIKAIPKLLPGAVLMFFIVMAIGIVANGLLGQKPGDSTEIEMKLNVGVVCKDDSKLMKLATGILQSTESIMENINLEFLDEDEAQQLLDDNKLMAVLLIEKDTAKNIMNGTNTPIQIWFQKNAGYEAAAIQEIADAATMYLASAQAGIYSVYDFYNENNKSSYINDALDRLNAGYIKLVLIRENFFENTTVVPTGDLSIPEYYMISGLILFMFMFGVNSLTFSQDYSREIISNLQNCGVGRIKQMIARLLGIFSVYTVMQTVILIGAAIIGKISILAAVKIWPAMLLITLSISSLILLIQVWIKNKTAAVMTTFFVAIVQAFITGGLIPQMMLPDILQSVSRFTPAYYMINLLKYIYQGQNAVLSALQLTCHLVILAGITLLAVILAGCRKEAH